MQGAKLDCGPVQRVCKKRKLHCCVELMFVWKAFIFWFQYRGVLAMADENEVKQVQEPAQEQQQQQSTEQKPTQPPPPATQVAETQAPEAAEAPSENPNP